MLTTEDCLQLVLDSESDYEKEILKVFAKLPNTHRGTFAENQLGYYRWFASEKESLIIMFPNEKPSKNEVWN